MVSGDRLLAAQHKARLRGVVFEMRREHLIDADAAMQHGALLQGRAGQDVAGLPGWMPTPMACLLNRPGDDVQPGPKRGQRVEGSCSAPCRRRTLCAPVLGADPVTHEKTAMRFGNAAGAAPTAASRPNRKEIPARAGPSSRRGPREARRVILFQREFIVSVSSESSSLNFRVAAFARTRVSRVLANAATRKLSLDGALGCQRPALSGNSTPR